MKLSDLIELIKLYVEPGDNPEVMIPSEGPFPRPVTDIDVGIIVDKAGSRRYVLLEAGDDTDE